MNQAAHQLINQTSGEVEYYTPVEIVTAARRVLRVITLDPASSENANRIVRAEKFFSAFDDGMRREWFGKVWMNHPFGRAEEKCESGEWLCDMATKSGSQNLSANSAQAA